MTEWPPSGEDGQDYTTARERAISDIRQQDAEACSELLELKRGEAIEQAGRLAWKACVAYHFERCGTPTEPGQYALMFEEEPSYRPVYVFEWYGHLRFSTTNHRGPGRPVILWAPEHWLRIRWPEESR